MPARKISQSRASHASKRQRIKLDETIEKNLIVDQEPRNDQGFSLKVKKSYLLIALGLLILIGLLYLLKGYFVAVIINGEPISRLAVIQELEKQGGKQVLNTIVTKKLVEQEARKKNITVSQKEIDDEFKKFEQNFAKQGQNIAQLLQAQGTSIGDFKEQIKVRKMLEKLIGNQIKLTDEELKQYIESRKGTYPEGMKEDEIKKSAKEELRQQKLAEKIESYVKELQDKAKIQYFVPYK